MNKRLFIVVFFLAVISIAVIIADHNLTNKSTTLWGRDTVKQFRNGSFEILRSSSMYSFCSSDNEVMIYGITHYYDNGSDIYLIENDNLYIRVDTISGTEETHTSIDAFDSCEQLIFYEGEFVELPEIKVIRNIWDIFFRQ